MPTGTFYYSTEEERQSIEAAIAYVCELRAFAQTAPGRVVFFAVLWALASDKPMATPGAVKPVDTAELLEKYDMGFHLNQDISVLAPVTTVDRDKQQPALMERAAAGIVRLGLDRNEYGKLALILPSDTLLVSGKIGSFDPDTKIVRLVLCRIIERRKKE